MEQKPAAQPQEVPEFDINNLPVGQGQPSEEEPKAAEEKPKEEEVKEEPVASEEETKVPYSRVQNIIRYRREAEEKAAALEARLAELEAAQSVQNTNVEEPPAEWFTLTGGDTPQSRQAYQILRKQFNPSPEYIQQMAVEAYRNAERSETQRVSSNEEMIDRQFDDLSAIVGRDLTDEEETRVLEIMDEYSPVNDEGRIISLFPAEKAWEVYELEAEAQKSSKSEGRNRVAALTGSRTTGEPAQKGIVEDKDFDPRWEALDKSIERRSR